MFPVIKVAGSAYERGHQYGARARPGIERSLTSYAEVFQHFAGWDWQRATAEARRFLPSIEDFAPWYAEELRGIAAGARVDLADILALNVRTEVIFSARVRDASAARLRAPEECSAFASVSPDEHVVVGQNWDWIPYARDTVVVLESVPDDGPAFVTVVEAGLLAKLGVNSDGLAVMTNALACTEDQGEPAIPYHVMLRALLDCSTTDEAVDQLRQARRSSSANYLIADRSGSAVDVEARPGGADKLHLVGPDDRGVLLHTNHFVSPEFDGVDYTTLMPSTSRFRLAQVVETVDGSEDPTGPAVFAEALTDHTDHPDSVCRHPDPSLPWPEQSLTVASVLIDLTDRRVQISEGPPCESGYEELDSSVLRGLPDPAI